MPLTRHVEKHFRAPETVRDIVIGMSDGLTVPFALAAGLSGAQTATTIIVTAGLAEIAAGSISMGLGGYLAARSDAEHYESERRREEWEVAHLPEAETAEVTAILEDYGLAPDESATVAGAMRRRVPSWIDFMMRFELGLEEPDPRRALTSAVTIGLAYAVGGFIPLTPYILSTSTRTGLTISVIVTLVALALFGFVKGHFTGARPLKSMIQTTLVGGVAAASAFAIARAVT